MRTLFRLLAAAALALPLLTCTISQTISLEPDSSGVVDLTIHLEPVFVDYLKELADVTGESVEGGVFDVEQIRTELAAKPEVQLQKIESPTPDTLHMRLAFRTVEEVFGAEEQLKATGVLTFTRSARGNTLTFTLNRGNFAQITELFPMLKNPLFEGLGPQENDDTTEAEYVELIQLAMGDEGAAALKRSSVETRILVKGTVVSQSGGTPIKGGVAYSTPLIRVLLLDKPVEYSLTFR